MTNEIKEVTAYDFAGSLWPTREAAEAKMAEVNLTEWLQREHSTAMDNERVFIGWIIENRKKLVELLSQIK